MQHCLDVARRFLGQSAACAALTPLVRRLRLPKPADPRRKALSSSRAGSQGGVAENLLSDEECRAYAIAVVDAVESGDRVAFNASIDWDALFDTVLVGMELTDKYGQELKRGS